MTPYDQIISWVQNRWYIGVIIAIGGLITWLLTSLKQSQELYGKLSSREKLFKKFGLEFVRIDAYQANTYWRGSDAKRLLDLKLRAEAAGEGDGFRYQAAEFLERATLLVELRGRFDHDPNPTLDILINNNSASPKILLSYGAEVIDARFRVISGGSVEKLTLDESDHYKIEFPLPKFIRRCANDDEIPRTVEVPPESYRGQGAIYIDPDSPNPVVFQEWEWDQTPVVSMSAFADPPHLKPGQAYRFSLEIEKSERMPTDTLLRVAVKTNDGEFKSDGIYFLKA